MDTPTYHNWAARRIKELARESQENKNAIIATGALPPLVALLRSEEPAVQAQAARTVRSLATGSQHNQNAIIAADTVPAILALLGAEQSAVQSTARSRGSTFGRTGMVSLQLALCLCSSSC